MGRGPLKPASSRKPGRTPSSIAQIVSAVAACASLLVAVVAVGTAFITYLSTYSQNVERDRKAAAGRMCESFATNPQIVDASDNIYRKLFQDGKARLPDPAAVEDGDGELKLSLKDYLQFFEAVGAGLTADVYNSDVIDRCLGDAFIQADRYLLGPSGSRDHYVHVDDFLETKIWAVEFQGRRCLARQEECRVTDRLGSDPIVLVRVRKAVP
ncbi:DUF4760 domain-containing protein [Rhizobium leguminosarum]|uniref:DUF4760 domain-containing protein n=1 Tax=Rhizobium leguminosarum TaxID=384 RepID=UPI003D7C17AC